MQKLKAPGKRRPYLGVWGPECAVPRAWAFQSGGRWPALRVELRALSSPSPPRPEL